MLPLSGDFSQLVNHVNSLLTLYDDSMSKEDKLKIITSCYALEIFLTEKEAGQLKNKELFDWMIRVGNILYDSLCYYNCYHFIKNKKTHEFLLQDAYSCLDESFDKVCKLPTFSRLLKLPCEKDDSDISILFQFFHDKAPELEKIYKDVLAQHKLFRFPFFNDNLQFFEGVHYMDYWNQSSYVFLKPNFNQLYQFTSLVHELGHAYNSKKTYQNMPFYQQWRSCCGGLFSEVFSIYYEQMFLEYCASNAENKDVALLNLISYYDSYINFLDDTIRLSQVRDQAILYSVKDDYVEEEFLLNDFTCSPIYGYGFLFANYLLEHPEEFPKFLKFEHKDFNYDTLVKNGFTKDNLTKSLVKRFEKNFDKY